MHSGELKGCDDKLRDDTDSRCITSADGQECGFLRLGNISWFWCLDSRDLQQG